LERLRSEIQRLKQEIKASRLKGVDIEGTEFFKNEPLTFVEACHAPSDRIRLGRGHIKSIEALAWSNADPDLVVTVGLDGRCLVWHAPSSNKVGVTKLKSNWVQTCSLRTIGGPSGIVATAGMDNICTLYSVGEEEMKEIHQLKGHEAFISACAFLDNTSILTAGSDAKVILWDAQKNVQTTVFAFSCGCPTLAISKQNDGVLVGQTDGSVTLCDLQSGRQITEYSCHPDSLSSIANFPNGHAFATGCDDLECHLYDIRAADNVLQRYVLPTSVTNVSELTSIDFSLSGRFLFVAYSDMIRVWDTASGAIIFNLITQCKTTCLSMNCDGTALCSGGDDSDGRIWCVA